MNDSDFQSRLDRLHADIVAQGDRVLEQATLAFDAYFDHDQDLARRATAIEPEVDRVDVEIERRSIPLLALGQTDEYAIRSVLTIVKINNEFERIGDNANAIAEATLDPRRVGSSLPDTFRVMANSVLGMLRESNRAMAKRDADLARRVLAFDDTVTQFNIEILRHTQDRIAEGTLAVDGAFRILTVTKATERIADHCTNICEQVIYLETGKIVRHDPDGWTDPQNPDLPV
ncbi:MAG: phosphate signaling complex protein PhoU [Planctomycetota bacterium]|nr:phosphate signaling complex protein PhoU [Planctomycetota bacterium]